MKLLLFFSAVAALSDVDRRCIELLEASCASFHRRGDAAPMSVIEFVDRDGELRVPKPPR